MKISFTITAEIDADPDDWRDVECFDQLVGQLEDQARDSSVVIVDESDAVQLWALVRPDGPGIDDDVEGGNVVELDQCNVCNRPIPAGEAHLNADGGGTGLSHLDCISDGTIDTRAGTFTPSSRGSSA